MVFACAEAYRDLFVVVYESAFQLLCLGSLLRARRASIEQTALLVAISFLTLADANYNIRTLLGYHDAGGVRYLGEGSYSAFSLATVVFIARCSRAFERERRHLLWLAAITMALSLTLQGIFVVSHLEKSAIAQIPFSRVNYLVYSVIVAAVAGLSVSFSLFTTHSRAHLLLQTLICVAERSKWEGTGLLRAGYLVLLTQPMMACSPEKLSGRPLSARPALLQSSAGQK